MTRSEQRIAFAGAPVVGTDKLAVVTPENAVTYQSPQWLWNRGFVLDSEISNAAPCVQFVRDVQRPRWACRGTSGTGTAMIGVRGVYRKRQICIQFTEKEPGAGLRIDQVGMFSYPAESSSLSERFFHHRRAVGKRPVGERSYAFRDSVG